MNDNANSAAQIMQDPAGASGTEPAPLIQAPEGTPEDAQKLLNELPGLIGALDEAARHTVGKAVPMVLVMFHEGGAMHASNMNPQTAAQALIQFADVLRGGAQPDMETGPVPIGEGRAAV